MKKYYLVLIKQFFIEYGSGEQELINELSLNINHYHLPTKEMILVLKSGIIFEINRIFQWEDDISISLYSNQVFNHWEKDDLHKEVEKYCEKGWSLRKIEKVKVNRRK